MRIRKGTLPLILGAGMVAAALGLGIWNLGQNAQAASLARDTTAQLTASQPRPRPALDLSALVAQPEMELPEYLLCPDMEMPVEKIDGRDYIGTLSIPALELELPILSQWSYPGFQVAPCRYTGSAYNGSLILAAHNYPSHFGKLSQLQEGDQVLFTDMDGNVFSYQMVLREILEPEDVEAMEAGGYDLTLFTCTLGGEHRVTVRCERESAYDGI